jgi:hypothetical protein
MKLRKNQTGFSAVELLLVLIFLAIVAFAGYYVYHTQKTTGKTSGSSSSQTAKSEASSVFKFPEMGVAFTLPDSLKTLTYTVNTDDGQTTAAINVGGEVYKDIQECSTQTTAGSTGVANIAAITKVSGQYPTHPQLGDGELVKQFPQFYIAISGPNGTICDSDNASANSQAEAAFSKAQADFSDAFKSTATEIK